MHYHPPYEVEEELWGLQGMESGPHWTILMKDQNFKPSDYSKTVTIRINAELSLRDVDRYVTAGWQCLALIQYPDKEIGICLAKKKD